MKYLLLAIFFLLPQQVPGQRVYDLARILPQQIVHQLENHIAQIERETTAELAVVTVSSLNGETIDSYTHQLFNAWGIGKQEVNNGILLLVAPNERRVRIEVGFGLEPLIPDGLSGEIIDISILPHFKTGDYPQGILSGVEELVRILRAYPDAARGIKGSAPSYLLTPRRTAFHINTAALIASLLLFIAGFIFARRRMYSSLVFALGSFLLLGVLAASLLFSLQLASGQRPIGLLLGATASSLLALIYNIRKYNRFGPHGCENCGTRLVLVKEVADDEKLNPIQKLEEEIGSIDYDVWVCPACLKVDTERYVKWFSGFAPCPKCSARTYKETQTTLRPATHYSTGLAQINGTCVSCKHAAVRTKVLPRITSSSSGSSGGGGGGGGGGSSFGGGSSGGGGSSRGW